METAADRLQWAINDNKLTKGEQLVMNAYNQNKDCVNDEYKLIEAIWVNCGYDDTKSLYWNLQRMPNTESIARDRRRLFTRGLIEYSDNALKRRTKHYRERTEQYGQPVTLKVLSPRKIEHTIIDGEEVITIL
jgi:hypothetical protein